MLILSRRIGENVRIGEDVTVTVLEVKGNQVRIGVNAPKSIAVHREEIFQRIAHKTTLAAESPPEATTPIRPTIKIRPRKTRRVI